MLIEFLIGSLPWSKIKDKESVGHMKVYFFLALSCISII
jgi:hypothetical protein